MRKLRLKWISIVVGVTMLPILTTQASADKVTLTFWTHSNPSFVAAHKEIIKKFEKKYPDIKIKYSTQEEMHSKCRTAFAANTEPDILEWHGTQFPLYIQAGLFDKVPSWVLSKEEFKEEWAQASQVRNWYKGDFYAITHDQNADCVVLLINKKILRDAGISLAADWPHSFEDVLEIAKKLTKYDAAGKMTQAGLGLFGHALGRVFLQTIFQQGGTHISEGQFNFHTPEAKKGLEFLVDLAQKGGELPQVQDVSIFDRIPDFQAGKIAMNFGGVWEIGVIRETMPEFEIDVRDMPPFFGDKPYRAICAGWSYVVSSRSKHKEEAWKYVDFAIQPENLFIWLKHTRELVTYKPLYEKYADYFQTGEGRLLQPAIRAMKYFKPVGGEISTRIPAIQKLYQIQTDYVERALRGMWSVEKTLTELEKELNKLIQK